MTVFEERAQPGGVIRYGVPAYRFDADFLTHELAEIESLGVKFVCGTRVDGARGAEKLLSQGYTAVFLAPGLWGAEQIPGASKPKGVFTSVQFLAALREGRIAELAGQVEGKSVAVIGGGSVAMDCIQSALKLGARDAFLIYRRSFSQMPAEEDERLAALRLGAHFLALNQPTGYQADSQGRLSGITLVRTRLGQEDASGPVHRRRSRAPIGPWKSRCQSKPLGTGWIPPTGRAPSKWTAKASSWRTPRRARRRRKQSLRGETSCEGQVLSWRRCRMGSLQPAQSGKR